ncbi:hypothetical protein I302_106468 [Kwoniella bestiolae CBS 10118]|uniref:RNA helicase n=1 Tax=Kwoniella bestiolae CBS 10118 TaxID=1296100 RepID=A0A1B9G1B3_9TREE|nr:hypothetical protein I302_06275 [Kwoniella bestiolae CBS 10118]OCF24814.1 hypothetical protein I302_06275 [Kwoniella bestiolae CBS 10118]
MSLSRAGPSLRPLCKRCLTAQRRSLPPFIPTRQISTSPSHSRQPTRQQPYAIPSTALLNPSIPRDQAVARAPLQITVNDFDEKPSARPHQIVKLLLQRLPEYIDSPRARRKLNACGLDTKRVNSIQDEWLRKIEDELGEYTSNLNDGEVLEMLSRNGWNGEDLIIALNQGRIITTLESMALRNFLSWTLSLDRKDLINDSLRIHIQSILNITDLTRLPYSSEFLSARSMKRHFHLHIGPTNSGKTYNALKALSKASSGAYAGPLRLLAHEVWERMNLGTVGELDGKGRACNLLTGEERRVVDPDSGLLSCTVEMLPLNGLNGKGFDVAVIDEIQMLGDEQRGGSWTKAVLGLAAKEIHLCGDETTVKLLHNLLEPLGDQITVHKYNRLTPLVVAEESLNADWEKVEKGDCVVTFSRTNIFAVKKMVESTAGKKCAVVYGALPPETRAEQARDFNDEEGLSEVLVASDAVGMGLNLKIKRMIFESLTKFNGKKETPLSLTQIKQIAGRAGRYKTSADSNLITPPDESPATGGLVTTLHKADLPILRELMKRDLPSIPRANLEVPYSNLSELSSLLPSNTTFAGLLEHFSSLVKVPKYTTLSGYEHKLSLADILEPYRDRLSLAEIDLFCFAPVNIRDERARRIFEELIKDFSENGFVDLEDIFKSSRLITQLELVEETLRTLPPLPPVLGIGRKLLTPPIIISSIPMLETLHKSLVLYIWLSFRLEVSFPDRTKAVELKERTEVVLDSCLERLPGLRQRKHAKGERSKEVDRLVRDWRRENVMPNGTRKVEGVPRKGLVWLEKDVAERVRQRKTWRNVRVVDGEDGR